MGENNAPAMRALPENKGEILKLPRAYIANVIYTLTGDKFQTWVNDRITERDENVIKE